MYLARGVRLEKKCITHTSGIAAMPGQGGLRQDKNTEPGMVVIAPTCLHLSPNDSIICFFYRDRQRTARRQF